MSNIYYMENLVVSNTKAQSPNMIDTITADKDWHYVGGGGEPAFQNSWENYGSPFAPARFRKDAEGYVHVNAFIRYGGGIIAFTLPVGYRPSEHVMSTSVKSGNAGCRAQASNNGDVKVDGYSATWVGFSIIFKAEQ